MRGAYLHARHDEPRASGCRGGVGSSYDYGSSENYELEIDGNADASTEMLSLCTHYDEIMEYLQIGQSHIGGMILDSIRREKKRLDGLLEESIQERDRRRAERYVREGS